MILASALLSYHTYYDIFLLLSVPPINALAGATDDCLLHACTAVAVHVLLLQYCN